MNKERIIRLIRILRRNTDMDHRLSVAEISSLLEAEGLKAVDRKTLYDDFRNLEQFGFNVEYDNGYYLSEAPFTVSEIKIIVVTSMPDSLFLTRARRIGVDSFWYKEAQAVPMLEIMDRTMAGERVFPDHPPITQLGLAGSDEFTERELEVLRLLSEGLTDREIAGKLFLSVTTVRFHINNLLGKTGLSSRTELAVRAVRSGIAVPGMD